MHGWPAIYACYGRAEAAVLKWATGLVRVARPAPVGRRAGTAAVSGAVAAGQVVRYGVDALADGIEGLQQRPERGVVKRREGMYPGLQHGREDVVEQVLGLGRDVDQDAPAVGRVGDAAYVALPFEGVKDSGNSSPHLPYGLQRDSQ